MTTNADLKDLIVEEVLPLARANAARLDKVEPVVANHELILFGNPDDRKDSGMVGAFNAMEDLFVALKGWGVWVGRAAILAFLTFITNQLYQMWLAYLATK